MLLDCQQISGMIFLTVFSKLQVFQLLNKLVKKYNNIKDNSHTAGACE